MCGAQADGLRRGLTGVGGVCRKRIGGKIIETIIHLKPCPFCGGEAHTKEFEGYWGVVCDNSYLHTIPHFYLMESEAIDEWNQRANPYRTEELLKGIRM